MKKKLFTALFALLVFGLVTVAYALNNSETPNKSAHFCPMKNTQTTEKQSADYSKITFSDDSGENCCGTGASCCKDGACCKDKHS